MYQVTVLFLLNPYLKYHLATNNNFWLQTLLQQLEMQFWFTTFYNAKSLKVYNDDKIQSQTRKTEWINKEKSVIYLFSAPFISP